MERETEKARGERERGYFFLNGANLQLLKQKLLRPKTNSRQTLTNLQTRERQLNARTHTHKQCATLALQTCLPADRTRVKAVGEEPLV